MTIFYLRLIGLALWTVAALALLPSAVRFIRGVFLEADECRTVFFFTALWFVGNLARWLIAPDETNVLVALNALAIALAIYVLMLVRQGRLR